MSEESALAEKWRPKWLKSEMIKNAKSLDFEARGWLLGSRSGWFTAEAKQITAEARQITAKARLITAEAWQITAVARQITAEAKLITAEPTFIHKLARLGSKSATSLFF